MSQTHIDLIIATSNNNALPSIDEFILWANTAIQNSNRPSLPNTPEISIRVIDLEESQSLNNQYRGKNKPTNVLSFPADFPEGLDIPLLGDLAICGPLVEQEAVDQGRDPKAHWAHIVIHGTLHLLGYDHMNNKEASIMESLESDLLALLNYPCPYHQHR